MDTDNLKLFITGSMVYGPQTEESDLDIVVRYQDREDLIELAEKLGIPYELTYPTPKELYEGEITPVFKLFLLPTLPAFNIIAFKTKEEFNAWYKVTQRMKLLPPILNRENRIESFHNFLEEED